MQTKIGKRTVVDHLNHFEMWIVNVEMLDNIIGKQNDEKNNNFFVIKNENISISFINFFFFYSHTLLFTSMSCLSSKVISMLLLKDEVNIDFYERVHIHLDKIMN